MANLFQRSSSLRKTYKARMPQIDPEFFQYNGRDDERAADRLEVYLCSLIKQRAVLSDDTVDSGTRTNSTSDSGTRTNSTSDEGNRSAPELSQLRPPTSLSNRSADENSHALRISTACRKLISTFKEFFGPSHPQVMLPADLTPRLTRNIVRMVEGEPSGIRGCAVVVILHHGTKKVTLGKIVCDPTRFTETQLYLHLNRIDHPNSSYTSHVSQQQNGESEVVASNGNYIYISPGYTLEKRRKTRRLSEAEINNRRIKKATKMYSQSLAHRCAI